MTKHVKIEMSPRDRFMKLANAELDVYSRRDTQARKEKREERAKQVFLNLDVDQH